MPCAQSRQVVDSAHTTTTALSETIERNGESSEKDEKNQENTETVPKPIRKSLKDRARVILYIKLIDQKPAYDGRHFEVKFDDSLHTEVLSENDIAQHRDPNACLAQCKSQNSEFFRGAPFGQSCVFVAVCVCVFFVYSWLCVPFNW